MSVIDSKEPAPFSMDQADYYEARPDGFHVASWCPSPTPTVPPTQVHLFIALGGLGKGLIRFKSPRTLDKLIDALIAHREDVWGKR